MSKDAPVLSLDTVRARLRTHGISYEPFPIDLEPDIRDVACPQIPGAPGLRFGVTYRKDLAVDLSTSDDEEQDEDGVKAATGKSNKRETKKGKKTKRKKGKEAKGKKAKDADDDEDEVDDKTVKDKARAKEEAKIRMLFARLDKNQWQYQGQYALKPTDPLTVEEWKEQPLQVRRTWAQRLSVRGWGRWLRADITLRRQLGRTPTEAEKKAALKDKGDKFLTVTPEEIGKLLDSGEVVIRVSAMKCVGYNADFQRVLAEKMPLFVPKPQPKKNGATSKPKRARKTSSTKRGAASVSLGQKRKRQEESDNDSEDSEEDSDDVSESEDEDWGPKEKVYQHRGTQSRSIVL
ncbi:hypothetical protein DFH08DRAFT_979972 [Mycena albidolilacea]|uniref:DUF6697 domain-containing protein n=1 Tax=Mycena albidolilacea TaxID=1033008 RepID=A0AAD7ATB3_9AGAR|nr:hypothetical protein DFH08DRAFT_979972 [Mycena albidolilacea]